MQITSKKMRRLIQYSVILWVGLFIGCRNERLSQAIYIPQTPNYEDTMMWYIEQNAHNTGADVFYIPSTWEYDWYNEEGILSHYADPYNIVQRNNMKIEMLKIAAYMAENNNFYSPYYRHITLDTWATLNEDTINRRYHAVSFVDIQNAFQYYLNHHNNQRPFVLAGFSQGGKSVVELMKTLSEDVRQRMVAAYVLGYKVTPADTLVAPWIIGAKDSADIGVTICYNSVSDVKYIKPVISSPNVMSINPVNWRVDETPAYLHDSITVTLSTEHNVLILDGFDGSYLPNILNILNQGDYHSIEPWLYSEQLRDNVQLRIHKFNQNNNSIVNN